LGIELFPGLGPFGIGVGLRSHTVFDGDGFNTAEIGLVYRGRR